MRGLFTQDINHHAPGDSDQNLWQQGDWGDSPSTIIDFDGDLFLSAPTQGHSSGHTGGTGGSGGTASTTTSSSTSGFVINITWDASVSGAPAGFTTAVMNAVQYLESQFSNPVSVNIDVGYGEVMGGTMGSGALGESVSYLNSVSYSTLVGALKANATTTADQSAVATLPSTSPTGGTYWVTTADEKALGLTSGSSVDGYVGFASTYPFTFNDSSGVAADTYDLNSVVLHEVTEVMGRMLLDGGPIGSASNGYYPLDLFHYSAAGTRDFSFGTPGYLSTDGGVTDSGDLNTASGGDPGDWASSMGNDAANAFSNSGVVNSFSADDLTTMNLLGWEAAGSVPPPPPPPPPTAPTGVATNAVTQSLATMQSGSGLPANTRLSTVKEVGGTSGDSYSYTLGGGGAGSFTLTSSNNIGTLSTGSAGVAGATNGAVFALTVTANDTTNGMSSPASPLDVVVGSSGNDTINLATLLGAGSTATPSFVFGQGGNDTINGTGMTSKLWIDGGAGADVMTGGSGANVYLYGAVSDSTPTSMDVITNFHASDLIDLTGLGISLSNAGSLPATITTGHGKNASTTNQVLGAHAFGWQASNGNTLVYVNTGSASEALGAANMKVELQGSIALTSANFLHN